MCPSAQLQQRSFIFDRDTLNFGILLQAFEVFVGQRLDRGVLSLADPCDGELHWLKILTAEAFNRRVRRACAEFAEKTNFIFERQHRMISCSWPESCTRFIRDNPQRRLKLGFSANSA